MQKDHHLQLIHEKKVSEERLKAANSSLSHNQEELDQLKTKGIGSIELNREILDDSEEAEEKIVKSTNERLESLLDGLCQGLLPFALNAS